MGSIKILNCKASVSYNVSASTNCVNTQSGVDDSNPNFNVSVSEHHCICTSEIDISVSKLLGFETFAKSLRFSVSENLDLECQV